MGHQQSSWAKRPVRSTDRLPNCETGRYDLNKSPKYNSKLEIDNEWWRKCCKICCGPQAETLSHQPFFEQHFLATCTLYQNTRLLLNDTIKSASVSWDTNSPVSPSVQLGQQTDYQTVKQEGMISTKVRNITPNCKICRGPQAETLSHLPSFEQHFLRNLPLIHWVV